MKKRFVVPIALVLIAGAGLWFGNIQYQTARIGTGYVAKQTCSCLFVAHRAPDSCPRDYDPAAIKPLTVQPAASSVTVSALGGLISAQAQFEEGFGCHLVN